MNEDRENLFGQLLAGLGVRHRPVCGDRPYGTGNNR